MPKIGLVTYHKLPDLHKDEQPLLHTLRQRGVEAQPVIWNAPGVRWEDFDKLVLRSTWDYHLLVGEFKRWLDQIESLQIPLINPAPIVGWNMDKSYLLELQSKGISIIPTALLSSSSSTNLAEVLAERGWQRAVVKPAISASADNTWVASLATAMADQPRVDKLLAQFSVLVQPFMPQIEEEGEWSFIFFDRRFSHSVIKRPAHGDFRTQEEWGGDFAAAAASSDLIAQAQRVVDAVDGPLAYARVDGVEEDGRLLLMEFELIEPYLFLGEHLQAAERFAEVLLAR